MSVTYVSSLSLSLSPRCVSVHLFTCQSEMSNGNWMINCWLIPMIAKSYYLFFLEMYLEISFHIRWATLYYFVLLLTPLLVSKSSLLQWRWWTNEVAYFCTPFIQSTDDQLTNEQELVSACTYWRHWLFVHLWGYGGSGAENRPGTTACFHVSWKTDREC